jgi:MFS transporter, SP family, general alpha glucoside:H+ symporter
MKHHERDVDAKTEPIRFPEKDHIAHTRSNSIVIRNAKSATDKEHKMSLMQGIRLYPKAVAWSMLISLCIAMEGYQVCLLGTFCKYSPLIVSSHHHSLSS